MAKKEGEKKESFFSVIFKNIISNVKENVISGIKENIHEKVEKMKKKFIRSIISLVLFISGLLVLFLSLIFFLIEYLKFPVWSSLLIVGVFMIIISIVLRACAEKC